MHPHLTFARHLRVTCRFGAKHTLLPSDVERSDLPNPARLPPPSATLEKAHSQSEKISKFIAGLGTNVNPEVAGYCLQAQPAIKAVIKGILFVYPYYKAMYEKIYELYSKMPYNLTMMVFGVALCFFGGTYVASIAAIEAFRQLGWQTTYENIQLIRADAQVILAASEEDDKLDKDGNNVADVDEMEPADLAQHKLKVAMTAVKEPDRLQKAFGGLFASYLAVLATLRLEFARTTAFALGIVEMAKYPIIRFFTPALSAALGPDMAHWTQTLVETALTFVAVIFAWWLQMIISAFYSGLRGGRMFADHAIAYLVDKDLMGKVPLIKQPFDPDESFLDEIVGYSLAAFGFMFQILNGFTLPFPLNLVFLPLTIIEWFLRFQISMESSSGMVG